MSDVYAPRAVAMVALGSLVAGFLLVFGGGMLFLRPRSDGAGAGASEPTHAAARDGGAARAVARADAVSAGTTSSAEPSGDDAREDAGGAAGPAPEPVSAAGITIGPSSNSRCFDQGNPAVIPGSQCDRLTGLDAFLASRAAEIAACSRNGAHGRLALVLDFRFSTNYMRGWGSPTSNVPNAGNVAACVKTAITPLPFATITHAHDRYVLVVPIDW